MTLNLILQAASVLCTGLIAGLWYGWTVSVIPGTKLISDYGYIETMQNINTAIINPGFIPIFMGTPILVGITAILHITNSETKRQGYLLLASALVYFVLVFLVTGTGNVPLNNALDSFKLESASEEELLQRRESYETAWNRWHYVRTFGNLVAFVLAIASMMIDGDGVTTNDESNKNMLRGLGETTNEYGSMNV